MRPFKAPLHDSPFLLVETMSIPRVRADALAEQASDLFVQTAALYFARIDPDDPVARVLYRAACVLLDLAEEGGDCAAQRAQSSSEGLQGLIDGLNDVATLAQEADRPKAGDDLVRLARALTA